MPTRLEEIKNACAYIDAGGARGTGYLVSPDTLITCDHVVRQIADGQSVTLRFGALSREARVITRDRQADCAVLQMSSPLKGVEPLRLATKECSRGDVWDAYGFPAVTREAGHVLSGDVQDPQGKDPFNNDAVVLYSREIAAADGAPPQGFSGTPVLVGGYVVGHLKRIIPSSSLDPEPDATAEKDVTKPPPRALMGTLYACPSRLVANLLPPSARRVVMKPQPPVTGYDPAWYVSRAEEEAIALNYLEGPGAPVVLWGPYRSGKTTTLKYLLQRIREDKTMPSTVVTINLALLGEEADQSLSALLKEMATVVVQELNMSTELVEKIWKEPGTPSIKFTRLMELHLLPKQEGRVVLAIDRADEIWRRPFRGDFFGLLRTWADKWESNVWSRLRLILAVSSSPLFLMDDANRSPFNLTDPIELNDLNEEQMGELAQRYGLEWGSSDLKRVREVVGGQPYLLRALMYRAGMTRISIDQLLSVQTLTKVYASYFDQYLAWLQSNKEMAEELSRFYDGELRPFVNGEACHKLVRAGLLIEEGKGRYRLRYGLYKSLFG